MFSRMKSDCYIIFGELGINFFSRPRAFPHVAVLGDIFLQLEQMGKDGAIQALLATRTALYQRRQTYIYIYYILTSNTHQKILHHHQA